MKDVSMIIPLVAIWPWFLGWFVPFATGLLSNCSWKDWIKAGITVVIAAVIGFVAVVVSGDIAMTWANVGTIIGLTISSAALSFWSIVKNVKGLKEWLYNHGIKYKGEVTGE